LSQLTLKDLTLLSPALTASAAGWEGFVVTSNSTTSRYDINWRNPLGCGTFGRVFETVEKSTHEKLTVTTDKAEICAINDPPEHKGELDVIQSVARTPPLNSHIINVYDF